MALLTQNSKLKGTGIFGFGITPGITCQKCSVKCYAVRGMYNTFAAVCLNHWEECLRATMNDNFITEMYCEINSHRNLTHVRVHTEGDFYSQEYLNKWARIARLFPEKQFYAYTKALHLDFSSLPENFKIIQSVGGEHDDKIDYSKPHAKVFKTLDELCTAGYWNCSKNDELAANPYTVEIGLVEH